MCGIIAAISKHPTGFEFKTKNIVSQMLYANSLRGFDSTGIFGVNKYGNLKMIKAAQQAADFLRTKTANDFLDKTYLDYRIVVGHNRASTKGATNDTNAHPFIEGHTCLVHNGTLHSHKHLKDVDVDSHAICHALNDGDVKEVIPNLDGAFALIWYDAKQKKLFITRNKERPLWIVETDTTDYIASEPDMITWILTRNGVTHEEAKYFQEGELYSYDLNNLKDGFSQETLPEKQHKPLAVVQGNLAVVDNKIPLAYGKRSKSNSYPEYKQGDVILLKHDTNTITDKHRFMGTVSDYPNLHWLATLEVPAGEELVQEDYFLGTVYGMSWKNGIPKVLIKSIEKQQMYLSCNGILVSEQEIQNHSGLCDSCGSWIDPDEEEFWVRYKSNKIKAMKCQSCVDKDTNLRPMLYKQEERYVS